jgi:hypothetical protein
LQTGSLPKAAKFRLTIAGDIGLDEAIDVPLDKFQTSNSKLQGNFKLQISKAPKLQLEESSKFRL